jgi:hypothetical protein
MWKYNNQNITSIDQMPEGTLGFIYKITNLTNGKRYIGRKSILSTTKARLTKKEKSLPENSRKTFKTVIKETNWLKYTGSCKPLNEDIKKGDKYYKEIIHYCFSKKQLTYFELKELFCQDVLVSDLFYNENVAGKFFRRDLETKA